MRALQHSRYGGPEHLRIVDAPSPSPRRGEVIVRVAATGVNAYDWHMMRADPFPVRLVVGIFRPGRTTLGVDIAGVVDAVGEGVTRLRVGDRVFGDISVPGGRGGGFAEQVAASEQVLAVIPDGIGMVEAAALPMASVTALQALRDAEVAAGKRVLVHGASGGVGSFAVQLAKALGAHVTATTSPGGVAVVERCGADVVLDRTQVDFAASGERWDAIVAAGGDLKLDRYAAALTSTGRYAMIGGTNAQLLDGTLHAWSRSRRNGQQFKVVAARSNRADLEQIARWVVDGRVAPIVDSTFPLDEAPAAIARVEAGRARGKVVVHVTPPS